MFGGYYLTVTYIFYKIIISILRGERKMRKCFGYMRVGQKEQLEESRMQVVCLVKAKGKRLIDEQVEELRSFCREKNYNVVGIIKDENSPLNPPSVLGIMENKKAETLVVRDVSRISYDVREQIKFVRLMQAFKKKIISSCDEEEITFEPDEQIKNVFDRVQNSIVFR